MKRALCFLAAVLFLSGCRQEFVPVLEQADEAYAKKDYAAVIDLTTLALTRWEKSNGLDAKARALALMGHSFQELNNTNKAISCYMDAVRISNQVPDAARSLGELQLARANYGESEKAFHAALRMRKDDPLALLGLGNAAFAQKNFDQSVVYFKKVLDVSPGVREALEAIPLAQARLSQAKKKPVAKKSSKSLSRQPSGKRSRR